MILFSIIYRTYRPGGFDLLADSLKNQTHQNYELIVVDDYEPNRRKIIREYLEESNVNVVHVVPSKKKCFPDLPYNQNNQINTGILLSKGDVVIIYDDYTWVPPNHLEKISSHEEKFEQNYCITPINRMWKDNRQRNINGLISVWSPPNVGAPVHNHCYFDFWHKPEKFEIGGTAFPYNLLKEINGFPECYDCYPSGLWKAFYQKAGDRAKYYVDHNIITETINHRDWQPEELWHCSHKAPDIMSGLMILTARENCFNLKERDFGEFENYEDFYGKYYPFKLQRIEGTDYYRKVQDNIGKPIDYKNKVVLDIGADYGSTAEFFLDRGAKHIVAVEKEPDKFNRLQQYANETGKITAIQMGIVDGRQVEELLVRYKPDIVKLDCEGCEAALFGVKRDIAGIPDMYIIEVHEKKLWKMFEEFLEKCNVPLLSTIEWARTHESKVFEDTKLLILVAKKDERQ